jgi:GNAT superfamily N-acetyltransferase
MKGGDFVLGLEKIEHMEEAIRVLHEEHYQETETLYTSAPFDPDYPRYIAGEKNGTFVAFTCRNGQGEMVGYLQYYVYRSMHSKTVLQAREDALFLTKKVRGVGIAPKLLKYAEHCLAQLGCTHVGMSSKAPCGGPDLDSFLRRMDYSPVATYYVKKLGVADAQTDSAKAA